MKKLSIVAVSLLLAATSAFAWSKKSENTGNLGRMSLSISGAIDASKATFKTPAAVYNGDMTSSPTGAQGEIVFNAPIFKPGINAFRNIKWAGLDGQLFFNYDYSGEYKASWPTNQSASIKRNTYGIYAGLTPYLNFETGLSVFKAIKPFGIAYAGYQWTNWGVTVSGSSFDNDYNSFAYGVGGGVEFVIIDELSFTPTWKWNGNSESGIPAYQTVGAELSYWITEQLCVSAFWVHNFGADYQAGSSSAYSLDVKHGDIIGAKFKLGFMR